MVLPTVLKRKHSLRGVNMLPLLKSMRGGSDLPKDFARLSPEVPLESVPLEELATSFEGLSGSTVNEVLDLVDREVNSANVKLLVHFSILLANKSGQPKGQELSVGSVISLF